MNEFRQESEFSYAEHSKAPSITIECNRCPGDHVGFAYKIDGGAAKRLHLANHEVLSVDDGLPGYVFWNEIADLEEENADSLSAYLEVISEVRPAVPYGLSDQGVEFTEAGYVTMSGQGSGLTCATFVLAVLRAQQLEPLNRHEWPHDRPDDLEFQKDIVGTFRSGALRAESRGEAAYAAALEAHAAKLESEVGLARFRPTEVAGACAAPNWPHSLASAEELAAKVLADLAA